MDRSDRRYTILVADDDPAVLTITSALFALRGHRVITAADGHECIELAARHGPDVILLDLRMPRMDGAAVARKLKADPRTGGIPIFAVAATLNARQEALEAGCEAALAKPVLPSELIDRIDKKLAARNSRATL